MSVDMHYQCIVNSEKLYRIWTHHMY